MKTQLEMSIHKSWDDESHASTNKQDLPITLADKVKIDDLMSKRWINLDPSGYFIIYIDRDQGLIYANHFTNVINEKGLACDPLTGEPFPVKGKVNRAPTATFVGRTAKEICIKIFEETSPCPLTKLDHAAYLGRELSRADFALRNGVEYIQD
jgi:dihydropteroate synthase